MRIADYGGYAGERRDFLGSALGVASGDDNFRERVLTLYAADGGARVLIGGVRDRARIQNHEVGLRGGYTGQAAAFELTFERDAVGLGGAASEVFDVEGGHGTVLGTSSELS
jgi:hypothetical protein